jgi:hypothetical protein
MGANNEANVAAQTIRMGGGLPKTLDVVRVGWAGVDHHKASLRVAY